tara:strand:+ start:49 stop:450 length:402 start_codon:yes stop_codon:yes gene_type:complete
MKVTKKQLRRIIQEEVGKDLKKRKVLLREFGSMDKEIMMPLVQFAQAWSGLGDAIQSQIIDVVNGYVENNQEAVYDINPAALDRAVQRLSRPLDMMRGSEEAEEMMGALDWAQDIFRQGDEEVEADARAAGDR